MKLKKASNFEKVIITIVYILLLVLITYAIINTRVTGFSINSPTTILVSGFFAVILLFFIILLILIEFKAKAYKTAKLP